MTKKQKGLLILFSPFVLGFILGLMVGRCSRHESSPEEKIPAVSNTVIPKADTAVPDPIEEELEEHDDDVDGTGEVKKRQIAYYAPKIQYSKVFADLNEDHLNVAKSIGLKAVPKTRNDVSSKSGLVKIEDNDYYEVDELRYSVPYLTKGGAKELMNIAKAFSDSLKSKKLLDYRLVVSSVLRTEEDVDRLRRSGNPNASENSAHCYGTTFDITYTRFFREEETDEEMPAYELTKVLGEVLRDEKNAGRCLVKYERKEHCFHITSTLSK